MRQIFPQVILISTAMAVVSTMNLPALAGQLWRGSGVISSGPGQGGTVSLSLTINGNSVTFHSGPSQNETETIKNGVVSSNSGKWYFERCGSDFCINFEQHSPNRTIYYRLSISS